MSRPVHFEIHAADMDRAQRLLRSVVRLDVPEPGRRLSGFTTGSEGPGINGGMVRRRGDPPMGGEPVNAWMCTSTSTKSMLRGAAEANGGSVALPKMAIPGIGWLAYVKDCEGNILGMMQNDRSAG
jgi:predicted enzyme related to lactoylglutathione lyase